MSVTKSDLVLVPDIINYWSNNACSLPNWFLYFPFIRLRAKGMTFCNYDVDICHIMIPT